MLTNMEIYTYIHTTFHHSYENHILAALHDKFTTDCQKSTTKNKDTASKKKTNYLINFAFSNLNIGIFMTP